ALKSAPVQKELNILKALRQAEDDIASPKTSPADKAIAVCWMLHLCGDIHQPLHCTTFFSSQFPEGDRGGNEFLIGSTNLHTLWDDLLGGDHITFAHLENRAVALHRSFQKDTLTELTEKSPEKWAQESNKIAVATAYRDGTLQGVNKNHDHDDGSLQIPPIP